MNSRQIDSAKPGDILWDDQIKGLHVRAFNEKSSFYLKYKTASGVQRRPKLGDVGAISLSAAREIARDKLTILAKGGDPDADISRHTVADLKERFMEIHAPKRKPKTVEMYDSAWSHALPSLEKLDVKEVKRAHIADLHFEMRSIPIQANRTVAVLRKAFNLAEVWGWREPHSNPVFGIDRYKEKKRRRHPSLEEAIRLIKALDEFDHPVFVGYIWLLAMTGCRPSEIRTAKREWIKPDGLHLPDSKVGERIIPLAEPAREVIKKIPALKGNPYLIHGHKTGQPLVGTKKLWRAVLKEAKIDGLQMRDLRRYFASLGISGGLTLETVGQLLGHTQAQTTKVYAYLLTDAATKAAKTATSQLIRIRTLARRKQSKLPKHHS